MNALNISEPWPEILAILFAAIIGGFVGATDLMRKYKDSPQGALMTRPARLYIVVNIIAAITALLTIWIFDWTFERNPAQKGQVLITQVLVAGLSAMVLFRSAMFTVRQGGETMPIGPANILQSILNASDRGVDRIRAEDRARRVSERMRGISFDKASLELPVVALALMQNLSKEEQEGLQEQIRLLRETNQGLSNEGKCLALGLMLYTLVGDDVLEEAINAVKFQISQGPLISGVQPDPIELATLLDSVLQLAVSGQNFVAGSTVRFNGRDQPTRLVASTHLEATLTAADVLAASDHRVTVFTPSAGGTESTAARLNIVQPTTASTETAGPAPSGNPDAGGATPGGV